MALHPTLEKNRRNSWSMVQIKTLADICAFFSSISTISDVTYENESQKHAVLVSQIIFFAFSLLINSYISCKKTSALVEEREKKYLPEKSQEDDYNSKNKWNFSDLFSHEYGAIIIANLSALFFEIFALNTSNKVARNGFLIFAPIIGASIFSSHINAVNDELSGLQTITDKSLTRSSAVYQEALAKQLAAKEKAAQEGKARKHLGHSRGQTDTRRPPSSSSAKPSLFAPPPPQKYIASEKKTGSRRNSAPQYKLKHLDPDFSLKTAKFYYYF